MPVRRIVVHSDIGTGEVREYHIPDSELPERVYATGSVSNRVLEDYAVTDAKIATGEVKNRAIEDYAITDSKIATGALRAVKLDGDVAYFGDVGPVPDASTEYAYGKTLVGDPILYSVTPTTAGVAGYIMIDAVSRTSITLKASVSGVYGRVSVWA